MALDELERRRIASQEHELRRLAQLRFRFYDFKKCEWIYSGNFGTEEYINAMKRCADIRSRVSLPYYCTGLVDKQGSDIYEGNIVTWKVGTLLCKGTILRGNGEWLKGKLGYNMQSARTYLSTTQVVGSIYDD